MNHFWAQNHISRENYLNESLFLKFLISFEINIQGRCSQKFAAGVTKLMPPDEIRSFDGNTNNIAINSEHYFSHCHTVCSSIFHYLEMVG
jgi:hypothetical protein